MDPLTGLVALAGGALALLGLFFSFGAWAASRERARGAAELALEADHRARAEGDRDQARAAVRALVERERTRAQGTAADAAAHRDVDLALAGDPGDVDGNVERLLAAMRARERAGGLAAAAPAPPGLGGGRDELGRGAPVGPGPG